ncbi:hypothetical protein EON65_48385 [archaeon]|nr:MAG: hypothetical protein EON65_48385 [archaeon]
MITYNSFREFLNFLSILFALNFRNKMRIVQPLRRFLSSQADCEPRIKTVLIYGDSNTWGYDPESASSRHTNHRFAYAKRWTTICQSLLGPDYNVIAEGLNNRTTVFSDTISTEGEYDCNGRATLAATLHAHKPLDIVVLALGANDLKSKFCATPRDITIGMRILVKDTQNHSNLGHFIFTPNHTHSNDLVHVVPRILVIGPPLVQLTALNKLWGFPDDVSGQSKKLAALMKVWWVWYGMVMACTVLYCMYGYEYL